MRRFGVAGERAAALFVLAILLFNPPLLSIFSADVRVFGLPLPYLYLFGAWVLIVALLALHAERSRFPNDEIRRRDAGNEAARGRGAPGAGA